MSLLLIGSFENTAALRSALIAEGVDGGLISGATAPISKRLPLARDALCAGRHVIVTGVLEDPQEASQLFSLGAAQQRSFLLGPPAAVGSPLQALRGRSEVRVDLATIRCGWSGDEGDLIELIARELMASLCAFPDGVQDLRIGVHRSELEAPCAAVWVTLSQPAGPSLQLELTTARKGRCETLHLRGSPGPVRSECSEDRVAFGPVAASFVRSWGQRFAPRAIQRELAWLGVVCEVRRALEAAGTPGERNASRRPDALPEGSAQ